MSTDISIKKGLDIKLKGAAKSFVDAAIKSKYFAVKPSDFHGIIPKLILKEGESVKAGEAIFYDKSNEAIKFVAPASGKIIEIARGEKRRILSIKIEADSTQSMLDHGKLDVSSASAEEIKAKLLSSGCWPFIKQRPYDIIANPTSEPKSIFISAHATAPLAASNEVVLKGHEEALQTALDALAKLTKGLIHVGIPSSGESIFVGMSGVVTHKIKGPHPSGNVGTLINKIDPVNKGEVVWTISPQDLVIIGKLLLTGEFDATRVIAFCGSSVSEPRYMETKIGAELSTILYDKGIEQSDHVRIIMGNVLTGKQSAPDGYVDFYNNSLTVIPEGDDYELFGWNKPVFDKISSTRALTFSWLFPNKEYDLNTNTNGEHRAFVVTGNYEAVFPLDIYPMQLLKSCMYKDLDEMEALGMYEVAPEDFALTEFVCVSKQPHQEIIREGLDLMIKEIG